MKELFFFKQFRQAFQTSRERENMDRSFTNLTGSAVDEIGFDVAGQIRLRVGFGVGAGQLAKSERMFQIEVTSELLERQRMKEQRQRPSCQKVRR